MFLAGDQGSAQTAPQDRVEELKRFGKPSNTTRALGDWLWNGKMVGYRSSTAQHSIVTARLVLVHLVLSRLALHRTPGAGDVNVNSST